MKNFTIFALIFIAMAFASLLIPYEHHDVASWNLFSGFSGTTEYNVHKPGYTLPAAYVPCSLMLLLWGTIQFWGNLTTAIISLVFSVLNLFYMGVLSFALTFNLNLFGGNTNSSLGQGYYVCLIAVVGFMIVSIIHLVAVVRRPKTLKAPDPAIQDELLDS